MCEKKYVTEYIERGRKAQQIFETWSQERVDACVRAIAKVIYDEGEPLAQMAIEETRMGSYEDKILKNKGKSKICWYRLKGVKSRGIIARHEDTGIIEVAKPMGIIGCISPTTNPTMTPMHNAMCALKGGNALLICPHPRAKKTGVRTVELMRQALAELEAPEDLIQIIPEPTMEISGLVMSMCDVCVATGGPGMVKESYSRGKPSFGVGPGNIQSLIDRGVEIKTVAARLAKSRTYDNGVLCTCEQCIHVYRDDFDKLVDAMKAEGAAYIHEMADVDALRKVMFPNGSINKDCVGARPVDIARMADLTVPDDTRLLLVRIHACGAEEFLSKEKLCPVMCIIDYDTWKGAVAMAKINLLNEGAGHSCVIQSNCTENIEYAGVELPVSRVGVNMVGSSGLGGGFDNGLNPTATLGCGSWGNNSISENLWWHHLVNISRIAYTQKGPYIPTDEEIWA